MLSGSHLKMVPTKPSPILMKLGVIVSRPSDGPSVKFYFQKYSFNGGHLSNEHAVTIKVTIL